MPQARTYIAPALLAACGLATAAVAQTYHLPRGCRVHAPPRHFHSYSAAHTVDSPSSYFTEYPTARAQASRLPSQYYTAEDSDVLYHPVVVPLEEFLTPRHPVALTPQQLARQRAVAEALGTPPQPPQAPTPPATPQADPFADDTATATGEAAGEAASAAGQPATTLEQPEPAPPPEAEAPPDSDPAEMEDDPFNIPE